MRVTARTILQGWKMAFRSVPKEKDNVQEMIPRCVDRKILHARLVQTCVRGGTSIPCLCKPRRKMFCTCPLSGFIILMLACASSSPSSRLTLLGCHGALSRVPNARLSAPSGRKSSRSTPTAGHSQVSRGPHNVRARQRGPLVLRSREGQEGAVYRAADGIGGRPAVLVPGAEDLGRRPL